MSDERRPKTVRAPKRAEGKPAAQDEGFLGRWSRRKLAQPMPPAEAQETAADASPDGTRPGEGESLRPEELPDIDSLGEDSDFTVFLKEGVPEALKRQALRRLWRSHPVFANLDGLAEYDEDYSQAATFVEGVKSVFRAGKGMREDDEESGTADAAEPPATLEAESEAVDAAEPQPAGTPDQTAREQAEAQDGGAEAPSEPPENPEPASAPQRGSAVRRRWGATES